METCGNSSTSAASCREAYRRPSRGLAGPRERLPAVAGSRHQKAAGRGDGAGREADAGDPGHGVPRRAHPHLGRAGSPVWLYRFVRSNLPEIIYARYANITRSHSATRKASLGAPAAAPLARSPGSEKTTPCKNVNTPNSPLLLVLLCVILAFPKCVLAFRIGSTVREQEVAGFKPVAPIWFLRDFSASLIAVQTATRG